MRIKTRLASASPCYHPDVRYYVPGSRTRGFPHGKLIQATEDFLTAKKTEVETQQTESASPDIDRLNLLKNEEGEI